VNEPAREPLYTSNPDPVHTRTIIIYWDPGSNFQVETTGTWLDWEVEAALDEAREWYAEEPEEVGSDDE